LIRTALVVAGIATTACDKTPTGNTNQSGAVRSEAQLSGQTTSQAILERTDDGKNSSEAAGAGTPKSNLSQAGQAGTEQESEPGGVQGPPTQQTRTTGQSAAEDEDVSRPPLGDLMLLTQLRHAKLWYAYSTENWKLVAYELAQFERTISRIVKLYPTTESMARANLIHEKTDPAMSELRIAVQTADGTRFRTAYVEITNACNQCHQAAGVGFIVVQPPTRSNTSNQDFKPR
jgi:hypothetical protein